MGFLAWATNPCDSKLPWLNAVESAEVSAQLLTVGYLYIYIYLYVCIYISNQKFAHSLYSRKKKKSKSESGNVSKNIFCT